jgi:hypothetical protein
VNEGIPWTVSLVIIISGIDQHVFRCVQKLSYFHQTDKLKANQAPGGISDDLYVKI